MKNQLAIAIALAATRHQEQFDKAGNPYILHTLKVMHYLRTEDQELMQIAVMHDLIEDTETTFQELIELGFSNRVIEGVRALTKMPGQSADEYFAAVAANKDAIRVKLADLRHNSDIRRLKGITDKDIARMKKYHAMYLRLKALLNDDSED